MSRRIARATFANVRDQRRASRPRSAYSSSRIGLPLGSTELLRPAAMANLLGDIWQGGEPNWVAACKFPGVKVHLYGKLEARPGRKMGHLTALANTPEEAAQQALAARAALCAGGSL